MRHWDKSCEGTIYAKHAIMLKLLYCYGHGTWNIGTWDIGYAPHNIEIMLNL